MQRRPPYHINLVVVGPPEVSGHGGGPGGTRLLRLVGLWSVGVSGGRRKPGSGSGLSPGPQRGDRPVQVGQDLVGVLLRLGRSLEAQESLSLALGEDGALASRLTVVAAEGEGLQLDPLYHPPQRPRGSHRPLGTARSGLEKYQVLDPLRRWAGVIS